MSKSRKSREASIHFDLYRRLTNSIESIISEGGRPVCVSCEPEFPVNGLFADLVLFDSSGRHLLVIEAKRLKRKGDPSSIARDIDPFSPKVIRQASTYATALGAPYCATYNGRKMHLFETFREFIPLTERRSRSYKITDISAFSRNLVMDIDRLIEGEAIWDNMGESLVFRIDSMHDQLTKPLFKTIYDGFKAGNLIDGLEDWIRLQGWDYDTKNAKKESLGNFAEQTAYLLLNRLLFYCILRSEPAYKTDVPRLIRPRSDLNSYLRNRFGSLVKRVDFDAIYNIDPIFDAIPIDSIEEALGDFIDELGTYDFRMMSADLIGRIYQKVIPPDKRHDMGQYYTPPMICDLICHLTIQNPDDLVFDPCSGSGGFLISSYHRLRSLKEEYGDFPDHVSLLNQLFAAEINRFPAHLSTINLALQDLGYRTEKVNVEVTDFFVLDPRGKKLAIILASPRGDTPVEQDDSLEKFAIIPSKVDVVLGNPPYIRQERILGKGFVRNHLKQFLRAQPPYVERINERSDIFVYFFTHGSQWLSEGGRFGFLTSERWLDTQYGTGLQEFFLEQFEIVAIIGFDKQMFEDALIGTCVTIIRKQSKQRRRGKNLVCFLRLKKEMELEEICSLIKNLPSEEVLIDDPKYMMVVKEQSHLQDDPKWRKFLFAPPLYFEISESSYLVPLKEVAHLRRGITSGSNCFFYRRASDFKDLKEEYPGLKKYFRQMVKAIGQSDWRGFQAKDTDWFVLDIHSIVERIVAEAKSRALAESRPIQINSDFIKKELSKIGHDSLASYIAEAEKGELGYCGDEKPQETATCSSRRIWFDLGKLELGGVGFPKEYWTKFICPLIDLELAVDCRVYQVKPKKTWKKEIDRSDKINKEEVLAGILNSDLAALFYEIQGRVYAGQALDRASMMVYEAKQLKILDPRNLSVDSILEIQKAFQDLKKAERKLIPQSTDGAFFEIDVTASKEEQESRTQYLELQKKLNRAVLGSIGLEDRVEELEAAVRDLILFRRVRGGKEKKVLITGKDELPRRRIRISGAIPIESPKNNQGLDRFI